MKKEKDLSIKWETIDIKIKDTVVQYPLLIVKIWGNPNLSELLKLMDEIRKTTNNQRDEYLSLTDVTNLEVGFVLESIISISMSKALKNLIGVKNKARLSFVLLGKDSDKQQLKKRLEDINVKKDKQDYSYTYIFIEKRNRMRKMIEEILSQE
jgi:hypothetical protein